MAVLWTISWIIAEAIPVFSDLIGLIVSYSVQSAFFKLIDRKLGCIVPELVYLRPAGGILAVYE